MDKIDNYLFESVIDVELYKNTVGATCFDSIMAQGRSYMCFMADFVGRRPQNLNALRTINSYEKQENYTIVQGGPSVR